jgi:DNA-binding FrmR family transcriptional regulator
VKIQNTDTKKSLTQRLRRIEGQVRGLQKMIEDGRDCREIMQQLQAAHSALESTSRVFLKDYAALCLAQMEKNKDTSPESKAEIVGEMLTLMGKAP